MCLATPVKVKKIIKSNAVVESSGKIITVNTSLLKNIKKGDYLYISHGLAIKKIALKDANKILNLIKNWES